MKNHNHILLSLTRVVVLEKKLDFVIKINIHNVDNFV